MDDAHWMAVFYHIILWEWIKTIPNNKTKQLKMSIHEYPGYFGSPGYPRVPLLRLVTHCHRAVPGLDSGAPGQMERIQSAVCGKSPTMAALVVGGPNIGRKTRLL